MASSPLKELPLHYQKIALFDLRNNPRLAIGLNLLGIPLFFIAGWVFLRFIAFFRADAGGLWGILSEASSLLILIPGVFLVILIHELIHGLFFWLFTKSKPVFAFKLAYAYAAAPTWYIPRNIYLIVGLAPVVCITLFALIGFLFMPMYAVAIMLILASLNFAGAVGDLAICVWLLDHEDALLIRDMGDAAEIYGPK